MLELTIKIIVAWVSLRDMKSVSRNPTPNWYLLGFLNVNPTYKEIINSFPLLPTPYSLFNVKYYSPRGFGDQTHTNNVKHYQAIDTHKTSNPKP